MPDTGEATDELTALRTDEVALRSRAVRFFGIVGRRERLPFGPALHASGGGWWSLAALWLLSLADAAAGAVVITNVAPAQLAIGSGLVGLFGLLRPVLLMLGAVATLRLLPRVQSRPAIARWAAAASAAGLLALSVATTSIAVVLAEMVVAAVAGSSAVVILPLLVDSYRPELRARVVGGFVAATVLGVGAASVVSALAGGVGSTWRSAVLVMAIVQVLAALMARAVHDIRPGGRDGVRVEWMVEQHLGGAGPATVGAGEFDSSLTMTEHFRRCLAPGSAPALLAAAASFGIVAWALPGDLSIWMRDRWNLVGSVPALVFGLSLMAAAPAVVWSASRMEILFRASPRLVGHFMVSAMVAAAASLALAATLPVFAIDALLLVILVAAVATALLGAAVLLLTVCEPAHRAYAAVLIAASMLLGGVFGGQIASTIGNRFGVEWALVALAAALLSTTTRLRRAIDCVDEDLKLTLGRIIERQELRTRVSQGHHLPLLSCRSVSFHYGQVQVLFDVSFTVDDGQMVALLGTNGAGKSTLLRLISGLNPPSAGSIHYRGADVTFLGADRRALLGISQVPGGRAVFPPMSVVDNLRVFGHLHGRRRDQLERAIDETFVVLPKLAERRNQMAATLSGGEQQMLGLARAFILRPRLLLIDELSLGLAPKVVAELLEAVRRINAEGAAVVLVEQSVNIALSVVDHAYFMEKGEIRFDGEAAQLLDRPDLLRSVFLHGATKSADALAVPVS